MIREGYTAIQRVDAGGQLRGREGLGDIVVGAEHQAGDLVHLLGAGGQHDDADAAVLVSELLAHLQTVDAGHHDIKDRDVKVAAVLLVFLQGHLTAIGFDYLVAGASEVDYHKVADGGFVFTY